MSPTEFTDITRLLAAMRAGDARASDQLFPLVYDELRRTARRLLSSDRYGHSFNPTDLVHEAWLRLGATTGEGGMQVPALDRSHFVAITVRAMRFVLIDHARQQLAHKRGGGGVRVTLNERDGARDTSPAELLALFDALETLGTIDARLRQVVESRFLIGFSEVETAELLGVTTRTVQRDWVKARAWLHRQLYATARTA